MSNVTDISYPPTIAAGSLEGTPIDSAATTLLQLFYGGSLS
ncbi:hypothetical protein ACWFRB_10875 [Rhodococcus sp. NPDC055112]